MGTLKADIEARILKTLQADIEACILKTLVYFGRAKFRAGIEARILKIRACSVTSVRS
jgi:hypothetical protein